MLLYSDILQVELGCPKTFHAVLQALASGNKPPIMMCILQIGNHRRETLFSLYTMEVVMMHEEQLQKMDYNLIGSHHLFEKKKKMDCPSKWKRIFFLQQNIFYFLSLCLHLTLFLPKGNSPISRGKMRIPGAET